MAAAPATLALDPQPQEKQKDASESSELSRLRAELAGALAEMETMKAVAEVSESTKAEAVAAVQRQCQEEVASLQAILKGIEAQNGKIIRTECTKLGSSRSEGVVAVYPERLFHTKGDCY